MAGDPRLTSFRELLDKGWSAPLGEAEYRRGYRDGWVQAIQATEEFMLERNLPRELVLASLWEFGVTGALVDWLRGDCRKMVLAPRPKTPKGERR